MKQNRFSNFIYHLFSLLVVSILIAGVSISRDKRLFGYELFSTSYKGETVTPPNRFILEKLGVSDTLLIPQSAGSWKTANEFIIYSSEHYAPDVYGYNGKTPVYIALKNDSIVRIVAEKNSETPNYMRYVLEEGFLTRWENKPLEAALNFEVDLISGATYTSESLLKNIKSTLAAAHTDEQQTEKHLLKKSFGFKWNIKTIAILLVVLSGFVFAVFVRSKRWRPIQLILNVIVLGFWTKSFLSIPFFVNLFSNGISVFYTIAPLVLITFIVILPFFGKNRYYCNWICPFGSLQELFYRVTKKRINIPQNIFKYLKYTRQVIFFTLLIFMWIGVGFEIMDMEVFSFFLLQKASIGVLILGIVFLLLSFFIARPYCRFVCPTGQLLDWSEKIKLKN